MQERGEKMNGTKNTLENKLNKSAQEIGYTFLKSSLGIKVDSKLLEEVQNLVNDEIFKTVEKKYRLEENKLSDYMENPTTHTEELNEALKEVFKIKDDFIELYKPYQKITGKLSVKRNNIYFVREETEQNAWRMAYFIKEMRISELQKKYSEPLDNEQLLLKNLTDDDMQSIKKSYDHIKIGLATVYAWQDFIKFLSEYFKIESLTEAIKEDAPSVAPIQALKAEAGRIQDFITEHVFEWEEHEQLGQVTADKGIDEKLEYYMPLIIFTSLLDIKRTSKESYQKIVSAYADYTVEEITENIEQILTDFTREIMKQNEGAE